jgi:uncharacterized protein
MKFPNIIIFTILKYSLRTIVGGYLLLVLTMSLFQKNLMYFPPHNDLDRNGQDGFLPFVDENGEYHGYILKRSEDVRRVAIFFHGNASDAIQAAWVKKLFPSENTVVILAEFPGYGSREGELSEISLVNSGLEVVKYVRQQWGKPVTVIGQSLGTGIASAVANEPGVDRLALISPFTSVLDVASSVYFYLPVSMLLNDEYNSVEYLKRVTVPLHIIHGSIDKTVSIKFGKNLFDSYQNEQKEFSEVEGAGHDMISTLTLSKSATKFRTFLKSDSN